MKTTEILKRTYYALIIGLLMFLINIGSYTHGGFPHRYSSFIVLFSLGICWIMTRHNKPAYFKWFAGIIIATALLYIYLPMLSHIFIMEIGVIRVPTKLLAFVCSACAVTSTFLSDTKYYNIMPNQSKVVSSLFRVTSWIGQLIILPLGILCLIY